MSAITAIEGAIKAFLRDSDNVAGVLEGRSIQHGSQQEHEGGSADVDMEIEENGTALRVLAVVSNVVGETSEGW